MSDGKQEIVNVGTPGHMDHAVGKSDVERLVSGWRPMREAPKDGTPVLLEVKKHDLAPANYRGLMFVGSYKDDLWLWGFAAPVGCGGFPDDWFAAWQELPPSSH